MTKPKKLINNKMDARQRINNKARGKGRNKPGQRPGVGTRNSNQVGRLNNGGISKPKNNKKINTKFDTKRLSGSNIASAKKPTADLRTILLQKKQERERKKPLPPKLQSRLGLQSLAARAEAQKELIMQNKQLKQKTNITNNAKNASQTIKKVDSRPHYTKEHILENNRRSEGHRDILNERRTLVRNRSPARYSRSPVRIERSPLRISRSPIHLDSSSRRKDSLLINDRYHRYSDDYRAQVMQDIRDPIDKGMHYSPSSSYVLAPSTSTAQAYEVIRPPNRSSLAYSNNQISRPEPQAIGKSVLVTNLNPMISDEDVKELFGECGPVASVQPIDPNSMLVTYFTHYDAEKACQVYNNRVLDHRPIKCTTIPDPSTGNSINTATLSSRQVYTPGRMYSDAILAQRNIK